TRRAGNGDQRHASPRIGLPLDHRAFSLPSPYGGFDASKRSTDRRSMRCGSLGVARPCAAIRALAARAQNEKRAHDARAMAVRSGPGVRSAQSGRADRGPRQGDPMESKDDIDRREFLATAASGLALTIVPRHVLGGAGYMAPSDKLTLA